jgi:antibiotic biosynthesis monooxygenase (ABM) superfamily enzyme
MSTTSRLLTTLGAWLAAYVVVMIIYLVWGAGLAALPLWARALVLSGVLATFMVNMAMPAIRRILRANAT